jgi:hypothetical protein
LPLESLAKKGCMGFCGSDIFLVGTRRVAVGFRDGRTREVVVVVDVVGDGNGEVEVEVVEVRGGV